jgi:hypothetical protein
VSDQDERRDLMARLRRLVSAQRVLAAYEVAPLEDLREMVLSSEEADRDRIKYGRLGAVWRSDARQYARLAARKG